MDKRRKYFLVLDVETIGTVKPYVYDLGFAVCDKVGRVYRTGSYLIKEYFEDVALMRTAYYADKVPMYLQDLEEGKRIKVPFLTAREELLKAMREFNVSTICAYNLAFDRRALSFSVQALYGKGKKFLTNEFANVEQLCIWSFACEVIYTQPTFQKVAVNHNWITEAGNMRTSAEIGWRYLTKQYEFEEEHTGLEDTLIEVGILAKCFAQHKKHESGVLNQPWRIVANSRK